MAGENRFLILGLALAPVFSACGSSSSDDGSGTIGAGGAGRAAPNTCPPTLVNLGSGPGIICDEPEGTTCSDTEQSCICGGISIDGTAPWNCVPTNAGCPTAFPDGEPCDASVAPTCDFMTNERMTCTCNAGTWLCEPSPCGDSPDSARCTAPGETCRFFFAAIAQAPDSARNMTCTCGVDQGWICPPR